MFSYAISHAQLMRESTDRVQTALQSADTHEQLVARRIYENPTAWSLWESEHSNLMRRLANSGSRRSQVTALKLTTFRLLHGKALFQYLRRGAVRGRDRAEVMTHFRPGRGYASAMVAEHAAYLRRACSYLCASHVGSAVVEDETFIDPLQRYDELYAEYFAVYCNSLVHTSRIGAAAQLDLLPLLKHQLSEYRVAILDPGRAQPWLRREEEIRVPTGDTQRLPVLGPSPKNRGG